MDSITQATLGAAVGQAVLGPKIGRRGALWGALLGTLPDLDVLAYPWLDKASELYWHRGLTHSIAFTLFGAALIAFPLFWRYRSTVTYMRAFVAVSLIFATHILIDCFTVYGTQVFEPFSNYRVGFDNLFIIDPLYTLPLLAGLAVAVALGGKSKQARLWNTAGLAVSSAYVLWSFGAGAWAKSSFNEALQTAGIRHQRMQVSPTPFNTFLWRALVECDDHYFVGYRSIFDGDKDIQFRKIPANHDLLGTLPQSRMVDTLVWFSEGYYSLSEQGDGSIHFSDLRFGEFPSASETGNVQTFFTWRVSATAPDSDTVAIRPPRPSGAMQALWERIKGNGSPFFP